MRRERLIWFAAGAATSSVATILAFSLQPEPKRDSWNLTLNEGTQSMHDGSQSAVWHGAEIARDCGAHSFEMIPGTAADSSDATVIPLIKDNNTALGCIVDRAKEAGLWFGIELDTN